MLIISGKTVTGKGIGRGLGFPTLNLPYSGEEEGVFVGEVFVDGAWVKAAVNVGGRPSVDEEKFCEFHLLDWDGQIPVGTELKARLLEKIRDVKKFDSFDDLKDQIGRDVQFVKDWYNRPNL